MLIKMCLNRRYTLDEGFFFYLTGENILFRYTFSFSFILLYSFFTLLISYKTEVSLGAISWANLRSFNAYLNSFEPAFISMLLHFDLLYKALIFWGSRIKASLHAARAFLQSFNLR